MNGTFLLAALLGYVAVIGVIGFVRCSCRVAAPTRP